MEMVITAIEAPIRMDEHGSLRVGQTRVLVDLILGAHKRGDTPESIAEQYTAVTLAQIYTVIAYYLQHQTELDEYLRESEAKGEAIRREIEAKQADFPLVKKVRELLKNRELSQE